MQSAIYEGDVRHTRSLAPRHGFTKRLYMLYLDLAELDRVFEGRWLWGVERARLVSFRRSDHLGDPAVSSIRRSELVCTRWAHARGPDPPADPAAHRRLRLNPVSATTASRRRGSSTPSSPT
jgi:DUF1365 family protein